MDRSKVSPLHKTPDNQMIRFEQACKQFSLETEHLETVFEKLHSRFDTVQTHLQETHTKLYGKLAELDFITHYLEAILQHISQGIVFIDLSGIVTTYNPAVSEILGCQSDQTLFHSFWEIFPDTIFGFSLKEALQTKQVPKRALATWTLPDGKQAELEIEATFVEMGGVHHSSTGLQMSKEVGIQGLLILIRNITEIRRLQALNERYERLKQLGELAALVAHEIRNPLGGIKGFASLLQQDLKDHPELQQMATSIVEGTEGLNRFVTSILNYTRPFQPQFESIDLVLFLQDVLELVKVDKAFHSHVLCHFKTAVSHLMAPIDSSLLRSGLLNLLVNALQAMPERGDLTVELEQKEHEAVIKVQDTGIGIPQENLKKIFTPFFTTKASGNGLGLAEVHKVIQAHHGTIEVESQEGQGTQFTIKIPLKVL